MQYVDMNIVLQDGSERYFIISVSKEQAMAPEGPTVQTLYIVRSKRVDKTGHVFSWQNVASYLTLAEAKARAKTLAIVKRKKGHMVDVSESLVPAAVANVKVADLSNQVTPEELIGIMHKAQKERYVILKDVVGMEDCFDLDTEYVGFVTDDPKILDVYDKFGTLRGIMVERTKVIRKTEQAIEIEKNEQAALKAMIGSK